MLSRFTVATGLNHGTRYAPDFGFFVHHQVRGARTANNNDRVFGCVFFYGSPSRILRKWRAEYHSIDTEGLVMGCSFDCPTLMAAIRSSRRFSLNTGTRSINLIKGFSNAFFFDGKCIQMKQTKRTKFNDIFKLIIRSNSPSESFRASFFFAGPSLNSFSIYKTMSTFDRDKSDDTDVVKVWKVTREKGSISRPGDFRR